MAFVPVGFVKFMGFVGQLEASIMFLWSDLAMNPHTDLMTSQCAPIPDS